MRSNWPVPVSDITTAGAGPRRSTAAPTPTASLSAPAVLIRKTHDEGAGGDAEGHPASVPAASSTNGPVEESDTELVTVPW